MLIAETVSIRAGVTVLSVCCVYLPLIAVQWYISDIKFINKNRISPLLPNCRGFTQTFILCQNMAAMFTMGTEDNISP